MPTRTNTRRAEASGAKASGAEAAGANAEDRKFLERYVYQERRREGSDSSFFRLDNSKWEEG